MNNILPVSIRLLFENKYLDCLDIISVLYVQGKRRKGIAFEELIYWITLLNCIRTKSNEHILDKTYLQNNYLNSESKLKQYVLLLSNQKIINVKCETIGKKNIIILEINQSGMTLINEFGDNDYLKERISQVAYLKKEKPYSVKNEKGVLVNQ